MKKRIGKRLLGVLLIACLVTGMGVCVSADVPTYTFEFNEEQFVGCAKETGTSWRIGTDGPYVSPAGAITTTTYCIREWNGSGVVVSSYITTGVKGKKYFTYRAGYENSASGRLLGYPANHDFLPYTVKGTWNP